MGGPVDIPGDQLRTIIERIERIHRSYLDCIPFKAVKQPPSNPDKYCEKHQEWCTSERDRKSQ